ncbi:MAG: Asp-tRNA(Asn)/Glu-tRNA(Gln) amidotransferase subunit GatA [Candidatus Melainabacteria bacterium]
MGQATAHPVITQETALGLHEKIQSGEQKAVSLVEATYQRIEATDQQLGAYLCHTRELAMETAEAVDNAVKKGEKLPLLAGVPVAVKDNINVTGYPTTCSSKILDGYISPYDATVTRKLKASRLPIVGKTNLDEFAMGSSTENSALQATRNPWDTTRVPGGSSGGSATTVAAAQTLISLGSDTGGSVRQPASLCGICGFKPTYGLVSRYGLVAFGSSLDQVSPFARNVADTAAILQVIAGFDDHDSTSVGDVTPPDYLAAARRDPGKLRVGLIKELNVDGMEADVAEAQQKAVETFRAMGATIHEIGLPSTEYALAAYYIIAPAEASSNLARFDGVRYGLRDKSAETLNRMYAKTRAQGFGPEVKRRIMLGTYALSSGYYDAYYGKAQKVRELLRREFQAAFAQVDILISPTSPTTAFKIGEKSDDPVSMYLSDIATIPISMVGIPAMSIPCGFDRNNLPIGLQIIAPHMQEARIFSAAAAFEKATGFANQLPPALA